MKKMTIKKKETKHHIQQSTWGHIVNHPPTTQSAAPQVQSSSSLSAPQVQSTCTPTLIPSSNDFFFQVNPSNEDALHSPPQVGGNSHVQYEHEQDENHDTHEQERPPTHKGAWLVDVIDDQCKMTSKHLKTNDVWNLPQNERIIVHWNEEYQPIGDGGALLNRFLGSIARSFKVFPICYSSWKKIPKDYKEDIIQNTIQAKFVVNSDIQISYILKALNHKWRDCRQELWNQRDDGTRTREELIAMAPEGMDRDHWASFIDYRLDERTKEIALKNKHNKRKQILAHTGGSKSIARKREEMEKECGHKVSRGEVWIATHKKTNGSFVNDEAREIGEKIQAYESTTPSQSKEISSSDSLAHVLGSQEHSGRVRSLGLGPCPSKVFGVHARSHSGSSSSTPSTAELQSQVSSLTSSNVQLQSQVSSLTSQVSEMKAMMTLLLQNHQGSLPSQFVVFQRSSVYDQGSVPNNGCNEEEEN